MHVLTILRALFTDQIKWTGIYRGLVHSLATLQTGFMDDGLSIGIRGFENVLNTCSTYCTFV